MNKETVTFSFKMTTLKNPVFEQIAKNNCKIVMIDAYAGVYDHCDLPVVKEIDLDIEGSIEDLTILSETFRASTDKYGFVVNSR